MGIQGDSRSSDYRMRLIRSRRLRAAILNLAALTFVFSVFLLSAYAWLLSPAGERFYRAQWLRVHHELLLSSKVTAGPWGSGSRLDADAERWTRESPELENPAIDGLIQPGPGYTPTQVVREKYMPLDEVESFYIHREEHDEQVEALNKTITELRRKLSTSEMLRPGKA